MLYSEILKVDNTLTYETLDKILDAYSSNIGFYRHIVKINAENKKSNLLDREYADKLFLYIFNTWKNDIIRYYKEDRFTADYKNMAYKLVKYLEKKNPKDYKEVLKILNNDSIDEETRKALEKLKWNRVGEDSVWQYLHSKTIRFYPKEVEAEHRLYINCDSVKTHQIAYEFIKTCDNLKLPYRLKYDDVGNRADTIVIWSNTKLLPKYIEILRKIREKSSIKNSLHKPPVLTGQIDGWIGFASEPLQNGSKKLSFNTKREKHITQELDKLQKSFLRRTIQKKEYSYYRTILNKIIEDTIQQTLKYASNEDYYYNLKGYRKSDIETLEFRKLITAFVYKHQQDIVDYILDIKDTINLQMPYKKSKIIISGYRITESSKKSFCETAKNDSKMKEIILRELIRTAPDYGIDKYKYFFDEDKKQLIEDAAKKEVKVEQTKKEEKKTTTKQITPEKTKQQKTSEIVTLYTNEENNLFYVKSYDVTRFELHSACNPCLIDNKKCFRISQSDAKKILEGENNSFSPYKVDLVVVERSNNIKRQYK